MTSPTFQIGDTVKVARKSTSKVWVSSMHAIVGKTGVIRKIVPATKDNPACAKVLGWYVPLECLELTR